MKGKFGFRHMAERIFTPIRLIMLSFFAVIMIGAALLMLPWSTTAPGSLSFVDALFTATSATCVTGLVVNTVATEFTAFGHVVILFLVQIGGLGFMTISSGVYLLIRHKVSLRKRISMTEELSHDGMDDLKRLTFDILKMTVATELIGALLLALAFSRYYSPGLAVWYGLFHSVMAFCNSGFDIVSTEGTSYCMFAEDPFILIVTMLLIVLGGIGFMVVSDIAHNRRWRKLRLHTKIVIPLTAALILIGAIGIFAAEFDNPETIGNMSVGNKIVNAFFQSITARTAGFASFSQSGMTTFSQTLTIVLMFIGVCPGSTGGGIKTTTMFVLLVTIYATLSHKREVVIDMRSIGRETISKAATIFTLAVCVAAISVMALNIACGDQFTSSELLFEQVSAYATVGLSLDVTPQLNTAAKLIITINMYMGRIGSFGFFMAFMSGSRKPEATVKYPEAGIVL